MCGVLQGRRSERTLLELSLRFEALEFVIEPEPPRR